MFHCVRSVLRSLYPAVLFAAACGTEPLMLSQARPEPPGANCKVGGLALITGVDHDGDRVLDENEIDGIRYHCNSEIPVEVTGDEVHRGDLSVTAGDQARLARLRAVTGSLTVSGDGELELPALEVIGGRLALAGAHARIALPALTSVAGDLVADGTVALVAPALTRIGGALVLPEQAPLTALEAPALVSVRALIVRAPTLTELRLPALASIDGELRIGGGDHLLALELGALSRVAGAIAIDGDHRLTDVALPGLTQVGGAIRINGAVLRGVALPALTVTAHPVELTGDELRRVDLRALVEADRLEVRGRIGSPSAPALVGTLEQVELGKLERAVELSLRGFGAIDAFRLPALYLIYEALRFERLGQMRTLEAPALGTARLLSVAHASHLHTLRFGRDPEHELRYIHTLALHDVTLPPDANVFLPPSIGEETSVTGSRNPDLRFLAGIHRFGALTLDGNPGLTSLRGLVAPFSISELRITSNPALTSLAGVESLVGVAGALELSFNDRLTTLAGLEQLAVVGGWLRVYANRGLADLRGLGVRTVGDDAEISQNDVLTSLAGLEALTVVGGQLDVSGDALPQAEIAALRLRLGK